MSVEKVVISAMDVAVAKLTSREPMDAIWGDYAPLVKKVVEGNSLEIVLTDNIKKLRKYAFYEYDTMTLFSSNGIAEINDYAFANCTSLKTVVLRKKDSIVGLLGENVFLNTPIATGEGCIYVPSSMIANYKADTYWSIYSDRLRAIESYPNIGG